MIIIAMLLLKSGNIYVRKQGSPSLLPKRIHIKRIKIQFIKIVKARQCNEKSKGKKHTLEPCDFDKGIDLSLASKA